MSARVELLTLDQREWGMLGDEPAAFADRREDGPVWRWERAPSSSPA